MKENNEQEEEKPILELGNTNELQEYQKDSIYSFKDDNNSVKTSNLLIEKENNNKNDEIFENHNNDNSNDSDEEENDIEEHEQYEISFTNDYLTLFILFMSSSFNFSFLYLPFIFEAIIYMIWLESISKFGFSLKYYLQIFNFIYSILLLLVKIIFLSYESGQSSIVQNNQNTFLNLGLCYLRDMDSSYFFMMSFFSELIILLFSLYSVISIKFMGYHRKAENHIIYYRNKRNWKLRNLIILSYISILGLAMYNTSYLTLLYMLLIQFIFLIDSLNFENKTVKAIFKYIIYFVMVCLYLQILCINFFNIPKFQKELLFEKEIIDQDGNIKYYSKWTKLGINYTFHPSQYYMMEEWISYLFIVFSFVIFFYISNVIIDSTRNDNYQINQEEFLQNTNNIEKNNLNERIGTQHYKRAFTNIIIKKNIEKGVKKIKTLNEKIFSYISSLAKNRTLMFQISRIFSILWIYIYRNFYSINIYIYLFFSFLYINTKSNKYLSVFLLTPTLLLSLGVFHLSNIDGYLENKKGEEKVKYLHFALGKYDYPKLEYLFGHVFYINTMFLIYSLFYSEKSNKNNKNKNYLQQYKKQILISGNNSNLKEPLISASTSTAYINPFNNNRTSSINDDEVDDKKTEENKITFVNTNTNTNTIFMEDDNFKDIYEEKNPEQIKYSMMLFKLLLKTFFYHLDKITLIIMYFVSVYAVNLVHIILVFIFMLQIISPSKINIILLIILIVLQLLFLFEFVVDLLKVYFKDTFNNNEELMNLLLIYDKDLFANKVEIFLYAVIYSFHFQYKIYNYPYIKELLNNDEINLDNIINIIFNNSPKTKNFFKKIGSFLLKLYFWILVILFIFFSCFFEINLLFGIKLIIFFIIFYRFLLILQQPKETKCCSKFINWIFLLYCCLNTFSVYIFQLDISIFKEMREKEGFIFQNLPNIGFTKYKENSYYHFLPHFMTTFIAVLFIWEIKRVFNDINKKIQDEKFGFLNEEEKIISDEESESEGDEEIKDSFDYDKYYSHKYSNNYKKIKRRSTKLIKIQLGLVFTKLYWLLLFFAIGIIFGSYDLSLSMVIYILIFSFILMKSFYHILIKLKKYISKKSYYVSKVIRYKLIEKPRHIERNKYYRIKSFRYLLGFSLLFFIMLYFYGIFELFQYGCEEAIFSGCNNSNYSIINPGETAENYIKSFAFIFGIYIDIKKEGILSVAWIHLLLSGLICFGIYIHKVEDKLTNLSVLLQDDLRKLVNENNILEKYADINDLNILIKIGLTVAGIEIPNKNEIKNEEKEENRLKRGYSYQLNYLNNRNKPRNNTIKEEEDCDIKEEDENKEDDEIKEDEEIKYESNKSNNNKLLKIDENDNSFLNTKTIRKLLNIISGSKSNKQRLYEANSKEKIICFIKQIFEEIIIFLLLCTALGKLSIWTFIYLLISFYLIISQRSMWKFYIVYCFILISISIQSLIYITNINSNISQRINDDLSKLINKTFHFPLYEYILDENVKFFMGLGVNDTQVKIIYIEFILVIVIYIYFDYFSYSIYQNVMNLGENGLSKHKLRIERLNLDQRLINEIIYLTDKDFNQYKECLKCFDYNIGNNKQEFLQYLNLKDMKNVNYDEINNNTELKFITNPVLKQLIINRLMYKQMRERMEKEKKTPFKPLPNYLSMIREILYLNFHCLILIFIILLSIMIAGLLSVFYLSICLYFLIRSDSIYLGKKYYYPKAIKKILKIAILIDIILQAIYQTPFFTQNDKSPAYKIFRAIGLIKVVEFEDSGINIKLVQMAEVIGKALIYFFISLQTLIYDSSNFKKYYLIYLLGHKFKFHKMSLINSFKYNNKRIQIFEKSLSIRQNSSEAMEDLKKTLEIWNEKLEKLSNNMFEKQLKENDIPLDYDINKNLPISRLNNLNNDNNINNNLKKSTNSKNNFKVRNINDFIRASFSENFLASMKKKDEGNIYLEPEKIKEKIKKIVLGKFITKIYQWFHKQSASYKSLDLESKYDYEKDAILGHTKITSLIEKEINNQLSIIDLSNIDEDQLTKIELILGANFDKSKEQLLKEKKKLKEKNENLKFGLNKIQKKLSNNNGNDMRHFINKTKLKRINSEKDKEEEIKTKLIRKESEEDVLREVNLKNKYKFKQFEELLQTRLFKEYLTKKYQLKSIFFDLQSFFSNNFNWICYFNMILSHIMTGHIITLFYPISILCYAILESPRPKKKYWLVCLYYTIIILCIKFFIQLKFFSVFIEESLFKDIEYFINTYGIGFYHYDSGYSAKFFLYIFPESLILSSILIYRNILITDGLWDSTEEQIETIYQASERVCRFKTRIFQNKEDNIIDFTSQFLFPHSKNNISGFKKRHIKLKSNVSSKSMDKNEKKNNLNIDSENISILNDIPNEDNEKESNQLFSFNQKNKIDPKFDESKKTYFERLFPQIRNEKPGNNLYPAYTIIMFLIIIYILFFYTKMIQDNTYGSVNLETSQFSGNMVFFLIIHVIIIICDRIIYITQNPENIIYQYYLYRRNPKNNQGELIPKTELNTLTINIEKENNTNKNYINCPLKNIDSIKKEYNIFLVQNEEFNKPLLNKYILHIFTVIFSHITIFIYFPLKGNINLGNDIFCSSKKKCNNFVDNYLIIIFYILYMGYLLFSGMQIKFGFYDIKRKSYFKTGENNYLAKLGNIFKEIPFLYEIKNTIDWTFTSTCLNLFEWNKFEAIYDTIYDTYIEKSDLDSKPIGKKVSKKTKISIGASSSLFLVLILIAPLILFSSLNPTNKSNNLTGAQLKIALSLNYANGAVKNYNLFENNHADSILSMFRNGTEIWEKYNYSKSLQTRNFNHDQIQRVIFSETSDRNWDLAYPHIENLINLLNYSKQKDLTSIQLSIEYELIRPLPSDAEKCTYISLVPIFEFNKSGQEKGKQNLDELREALEKCRNFNIKIENAYYTPLRLTSSPTVNIIEDEEYFQYKDILLGFQGCKFVEGEKNFLNSFFTVKTIDKNNSTSPFEIHVFNDEISEATSGYSVLTFYITFVLLAGTYIRNFLSSEPEKIILGEMPHAKEIVNLCEGVKIARYGYDFKNEEYLYTVLIELMRSPDYLKMLTSSSLQQFKIREKMLDNNSITE